MIVKEPSSPYQGPPIIPVNQNVVKPMYLNTLWEIVAASIFIIIGIILLIISIIKFKKS